MYALDDFISGLFNDLYATSAIGVNRAIGRSCACWGHDAIMGAHTHGFGIFQKGSWSLYVWAAIYFSYIWE